MSNCPSAQAFREAADTLAALIDKLPTLDVTWTPEIQADWFKAFDVLMEKVRGHLLAAAEQREQWDSALKKIDLRERADIHGANPLPWIEAQRDTAEARVKELREQIATLTAERDDFRAEIGKLAGACTVLHANNAGLERERDEARATLAQVREWEKSMPTYNFLTVAFAKLRLILNPPAPGAER